MSSAACLPPGLLPSFQLRAARALHLVLRTQNTLSAPGGQDGRASRSVKVPLLEILLSHSHPPFPCLPSAVLCQINLCLFKRRGISHKKRGGGGRGRGQGRGAGEVVRTTLLMINDGVCLGYYSLY